MHTRKLLGRWTQRVYESRPHETRLADSHTHTLATLSDCWLEGADWRVEGIHRESVGIWPWGGAEKGVLEEWPGLPDNYF